MRIRQAGPDGALRPFKPTPAASTEPQQKLDALEHIARALSGIDHNLEALANSTKKQAVAMEQLVEVITRLAPTR